MRAFRVEIIQPSLGSSPLDEVLPENHTPKYWEATGTKPLARGRVRDAGKDGEFLRVQRLIHVALLDDFVHVYATELFILRHSLPIR